MSTKLKKGEPAKAINKRGQAEDRLQDAMREPITFTLPKNLSAAVRFLALVNGEDPTWYAYRAVRGQIDSDLQDGLGLSVSELPAWLFDGETIPEPDEKTRKAVSDE